MIGIDTFGGDRPLALAATKTGPDAVLRHDGGPAESESRAFVGGVRGPVQIVQRERTVLMT